MAGHIEESYGRRGIGAEEEMIEVADRYGVDPSKTREDADGQRMPMSLAYSL